MQKGGLLELIRCRKLGVGVGRAMKSKLWGGNLTLTRLELQGSQIAGLGLNQSFHCYHLLHLGTYFPVTYWILSLPTSDNDI